MNNIDIPISILEAGTFSSLQKKCVSQLHHTTQLKSREIKKSIFSIAYEVTFLLLLLLYCVRDSNPCDKNENLIS